MIWNGSAAAPPMQGSDFLEPGRARRAPPRTPLALPRHAPRPPKRLAPHQLTRTPQTACCLGVVVGLSKYGAKARAGDRQGQR